MSAKHLIVTAALVAAGGAACAAAPGYMRPGAEPGQDAPMTRAQVQQELHQAQSQGLLSQSDERYPVLPQSGQRKMRAQVLEELRQAHAQGLTNSRDDLYPIIPDSSSHRSRAEVRTEAVQAARTEFDRRFAHGLYFGG